MSRYWSRYCEFCSKLIASENLDYYELVTSWVHGPKLDSPILRERQYEYAHGECVRKVKAGQDPSQPDLLENEL